MIQNCNINNSICWERYGARLMVPIASGPCDPQVLGALHHTQRTLGVVWGLRALVGWQGPLSHATETSTPHWTEFSSVLAFGKAPPSTRPYHSQYNVAVTPVASLWGPDTNTLTPGGYTQQERRVPAIIPCVRTLLQHSGPNTRAPAPTQSCPPHQTIHTKREYYHQYSLKVNTCLRLTSML